MNWMRSLFSKAKIQLLSQGPRYGCFQLNLPKPQAEFPKLVLLMQPGSSAQFRWSVFTFDSWGMRRGVHAWIHNPEGWGKWGGWKERRLLRRQSPFSTNHSKSLFVLDPCSTPPTPTLYTHHPAAVIKHSFISLHPLVQFGHIIPCLSRGNLREWPEHTHLIYCVCRYAWRSKKEGRNM